MNLDLYQTNAVTTALPSALRMEYLTAGLAAEAGEVCGLYAKYVRDGASADACVRELPPDLLDKLKKELGDCLWFVALIAHLHGITLSAVAESNTDKLRSRVQRGTIAGSGDDR